MIIKITDPTEQKNWDNLIAVRFNGDIFHSSAWARVLKETYHFSPVYLMLIDNSKPGAIIPIFEIKSILTGNRGVSIPFTDFCNFLAADEYNLSSLITYALNYGRERNWRYLEFRSLNFPQKAPPFYFFYTHEIDLTSSPARLWSSLKDANRRNIKKAVREGLKIKFEDSLSALNQFYRFQIITRKRHGLPPQPFKFFKSIYENMILQNLGVIVSAYYSGKTVASAIFFGFNKKAIFKFGASDPKYHHLRPNNLIMWEAINWHRERGFQLLNLGRTEQKNQGLLNYKRLWGAKEMELKYYRFAFKPNSFISSSTSLPSIIPFAIKYFPDSILTLIGKLLYRHLG